MVPRSNDTTEASSKKQSSLPTDQKIARLLGFLAVKDIEDKSEQALILLAAGFDAGEISEMLDVNKNYAHNVAHRKKKAEAKK